MVPYRVTKDAVGAAIEDLRVELKELGKTGIRLVDIKPGQTRESRELLERVDMITASYSDVADGIIMAISHPDIVNLNFRRN